MRADPREIARYLGYGKSSPDPQIREKISLCLRELESAAPRSVSRRLSRAELPFHSTALDRCLEGCGEVFLFAATLGAQADTLLRRWSARDMSLAVVGQACAAAALESYCDDCMENLASALPRGLHLRPRFSPGYGDFSLEHQRWLLGMLDAGRRIGLHLTGGGMLVPAKSVTAVAGIAPSPQENCVRPCGGCDKADCTFRKE